MRKFLLSSSAMVGRLLLVASILSVFASSTAHAACVSPSGVEGDMLYNDDTNAFQFCNGQNWVPMGTKNPSAANGTCAGPVGGESQILYNRDYHVLQYCNGQEWMTFWPNPNWWWVGATLDMDFTTDRYRLNGTSYAGIASFITAAGGTFTRSTTATYFDSSGVMQTAAANTPRLDRDPATHEAKGVLIEESRTNIHLYSSDFSSWSTKSNVTITANAATAPDGTITASLVTATGAGLSYISRSPTITAGATYTRSVYAKAGTSAAVIFEYLDNGALTATRFQLDTGTIGSDATGTAQIISVGNGWYRCSATKTFTAAGGVDSVIYIDKYGVGDAGDGVYLWGAQLEQGSFPTSYIPTTSAAATRAADVFTIPLGSWFDSTQGTFISRSNTFDNNPYSNDYRRHVWLVSESGFTRLSLRAAIGQSGNTNAPHGVIGDGAAAYSLIPAGTVASNVFTKAALAYSAASPPGAGLSVDGAATVASAHACTPDTSTGLLVGGATVGNQRQLTGYISRLTYMPTRQPDASLADYTR